jgi:hypothetical protein
MTHSPSGASSGRITITTTKPNEKKESKGKKKDSQNMLDLWRSKRADMGRT